MSNYILCFDLLGGQCRVEMSPFVILVENNFFLGGLQNMECRVVLHWNSSCPHLVIIGVLLTNHYERED